MRFVRGIASPEYDVGVASTKKKRAAIMSVLDRYMVNGELGLELDPRFRRLV